MNLWGIIRHSAAFVPIITYSSERGRMTKQPSGKTTRMTRKHPEGSRPGRRSADPKEAYTTEQLAEIGAITLIWNHIDDFVDWLLHIALGTPISVLWEVGRAIGDTEAKLDLLKTLASRSRFLNDGARACIDVSFSAIREYKGYRNTIVHSVPFDADRGIALSMDRRANSKQTLVSQEALLSLYTRMKILFEELREIDLLFRLSNEQHDAIIFRDAQGNPIANDREGSALIQTARCQEKQKIRLALPPLPFFPEDA
jgi:hypothetical protein